MEVLIVIAVLGFVMTAVSAAFVVIARSSPQSVARADDSRALLNLTNWLSQDVSSTSEDGFLVGGNDPDPCTGIPTSKSLLTLRWSENGRAYVASYRYVDAGSIGTIHRFSCVDGSTASDLRLTPELQNVTSGLLQPAPVAITLVPTTMVNGQPGNKGLQFVVTVFDENGVQRELLSLDATTTNVRTTLPPASGGPGNTNRPPEASAGTTSVTIGQSIGYPLPVNEPDGDVLVTTLTNIPAGWNITAIGTNVSITPDPLAVAGPYTFTYTVTDPGGLSATNLVDVTANAVATNQPPTASAVSVNATRGVGVPVTLTASDPEDGAVTSVSFSNVPSGWTVAPNTLNPTITPPNSATGTTVINYTVTDSQGATATSTITVSVCTVSIASIADSSVAVFTNGTNIGRLKKDVNVTISTNGACGGALVLAFKPKAADAVETTIAFNTGTLVTIVKDAYLWDTTPASRSVTLSVRQGANGIIEASGTLTVTA